jgi:coenzyme PQQ precursor peptide PqqA
MTRTVSPQALAEHHASRAIRPRSGLPPALPDPFWRYDMQWQTPAATDLRFGFEITMYVAAR